MAPRITTPIKRLGTWLARANNTVYQAATDGFVYAEVAGLAVMTILSDGANPPVTTVSRSEDNANVHAICSPIRKNDYWKTTNATTVNWIPLEP